MWGVKDVGAWAGATAPIASAGAALEPALDKALQLRQFSHSSDLNSFGQDKSYTALLC